MFAARRHWIFDMDGTLTVAVHDFAGIKRQLGLPADRPILEVLAEMPPARSAPLHEQLVAIEADLARAARPAPGAAEVLGALRDRGCRLGVLTRNTRALAGITLRAAGLWGFFAPEVVLGRLDARPKPHPDGVHLILGTWGAEASDAVMVGDYVFDVEAGRAAGCATALLDPGGRFGHPASADAVVGSLAALLAL